MVTTILSGCRGSLSSSILVGKKNGDVIAGAMIGFDGQRGWIYGICVHKTFRRQSFGKAIISAAEAWLGQRGAPSIHPQMHFTNLAALGFYDKLGYRFQDMVVLGKHFETTPRLSPVPGTFEKYD
jgi:ribosomal protein S18 acetylase RimI-like enzyme